MRLSTASVRFAPQTFSTCFYPPWELSNFLATIIPVALKLLLFMFDTPFSIGEIHFFIFILRETWDERRRVKKRSADVFYFILGMMMHA